MPSLRSLPTARALAEQLPNNASERFRETFLPLGHPPLPGSLLRRPDLAAVLEALGTSGPAAFYAGGNLTLEMVAEVSMLGAPAPKTTKQEPPPSSFLSFLSFYLYLLGISFT